MQAEEFLILADLLPEGMLMVSAEGEVLAINRAAKRMLSCASPSPVGRNLSELTGMSADELIIRLKPCSRSRTPVRLALQCAQNTNKNTSTSPCEGFLLSPAQDGNSAQIVIRINSSETRSDIFMALNQDIEKQRRVLRKLEDSREQLRLKEENLHITLNSIGDAVMVTDKKGLLVSLNPVAEQLTGWLNDEAKGKSVKTIFPIIDDSTREPIENPVEKVLSTGETVYLSNHTTLISKDGTEYQIADSAAPIRDKNASEIMGMVLVFNDVTEAYRLRELNARNRRDLQAILDNSPAVIYVKDLQGNYLLVNKRFEQLFHLNSHNVVGKSDDELFSEDKAKQFECSDSVVLATGHALENEESVLHDDGLHDYLSNKFPLYDSEENIYAVCSIATDISQRKEVERALTESEKKYSTLFEKSADAILLIEDGKFIDCNLATIEMLGYSSKKEFLMTHPSELSPVLQADGRDSFEKANEMMSIALENGSHRFEWMHKRKNGDDFPVEVLLTPVPIGKKEFLHVVWRDISERKQIEYALQRSQKMEAIGQLAGGVAHDFNNILGIILGNLDLLKMNSEFNDVQQKRIDNISHSTQRAIKLTKQLLTFSRHENETGKATDLNGLLINIQNLLTQSLTPQVEVELQFAEDLWPVKIDSGDFEDMLLNMALNARDAMQGQGRLSIETKNCILDEAYCTLHPDAKPGEYVQLSISDDGEGMSAEIQQRIFEPFFSTKEQGKGTGLGLAMVFGFVRRSGGSIKVYSEYGIGTTFIVFLPRVSNANINMESSQNSDKPPRPTRGNETILVVDDEDALLELVEETLKELGYKVLTASNGLQAMEIIGSGETIDLLFSDVVMPGGMNGFELAEQACVECLELKVLLTSGYTEKAIARNGQARFKANMLSKPYAQVELAMKLREMLD